MTFTEMRKAVVNELDTTLTSVDDEKINELTDAILKAKRVFFAGAGRSGLMIKGFAMRLMHLGLNVYVVGEMVTPAIDKDDMLVIASGSGETGSLVAMAGKAAKIGAKIGLITIFEQSSIGRIADSVVTIPAPTPKSALENKASSVQPMGSLFEQCLLLVCDMMIMVCMEKTDRKADEMFRLHANLE